jgi:uncharacterized protein
MPNPVVHFEIMGRDPERTREFYRAAFGWEMFVLEGGYALVETAPHTHDESTGGTTYLDDAAFMNEGVVLETDRGGTPVWRFKAESRIRYFDPGIGGGITGGGPGVSVSIEVVDLEAALARIESLGGRRKDAPREPAPGLWVASFFDPDGNALGLVQAPRAQAEA